MQKLMKLAYFLLALFVIGQAEDVITLTGENFTEALKQNSKMVVEFYAPWCGHCKKLAPEFEKAAGELKAEGIVLAKVDATEEDSKQLANEYGVKGYPTLKIMRDGNKEAEDYEGPRDADGIVSFLKKSFGPASLPLLSAEDATKFADKDVAIVGVFKGEDSADYKAFVKMADSARKEYDFGHAFDPGFVALCKIIQGGCTESTILLLKKFDDPVMQYDGEFEGEAILAWLEKSTVPLVPILDKEMKHRKYIQKLFELEKPLVIGFIPEDSPDFKSLQDELKEYAMKEDKAAAPVLAPYPAAEATLKFFGLEATDLPAWTIHSPKDNKKFLSKVVQKGSLAPWLADFKDGKIDPHIKSEAIPDSNDEPVKVVVAKQFDELVLGGKDVLIEFYAPWCGHCKKLAPIYEKVGQFFQSQANILVAKMDATANDVPGTDFNVRGFPTIYFYDGVNKVAIQYEGDRSEADLIKFVKEKASQYQNENDTEATKESNDDVKDEL